MSSDTNASQPEQAMPPPLMDEWKTACQQAHDDLLKLRVEQAGEDEAVALPNFTDGFKEGIYYWNRREIDSLRATEVTPEALDLPSVQDAAMEEIIAQLEIIGKDGLLRMYDGADNLQKLAPGMSPFAGIACRLAAYATGAIKSALAARGHGGKAERG